MHEVAGKTAKAKLKAFISWMFFDNLPPSFFLFFSDVCKTSLSIHQAEKRTLLPLIRLLSSLNESSANARVCVCVCHLPDLVSNPGKKKQKKHLSLTLRRYDSQTSDGIQDARLHTFERDTPPPPPIAARDTRCSKPAGAHQTRGCGHTSKERREGRICEHVIQMSLQK